MTPDRNRRALLAVVALLLAGAAALGGAATVAWGRAGFQVPQRGVLTVPVDGADLLPALGPLALLAVAAVAAVVATGSWARRVLGALLVIAAVPPALAVLGVGDRARLAAAAAAAAELPARSTPDGSVAILTAGPGLAAAGAILIAGAGVALLLRGHRMPRMGSRYRVPRPAGSEPQPAPDRQLWERIDAGEDPTASGDPR